MAEWTATSCSPKCSGLGWLCSSSWQSQACSSVGAATHNAGLSLLLAAAFGTAAFSLISGFSIGRFTAVFPALLAGSMLAMGRGWLITTAALLGALALYVICSWVLNELQFQGGIFAFVFGAWAIPFYAATALATYAWSATHPVR